MQLIKLVVMAISNQNMKYLRKLRGWTQEEFAQKLRIKRSLLGAYEEERAELNIYKSAIFSSKYLSMKFSILFCNKLSNIKESYN